MFIYRYIFASSGLGGLMGIYNTHNAYVLRDVNNKKNVNKMLIGERIPIIFTNIVTGPYIMPFRIFDIMNQIEIKYRKDDINNYFDNNNKKTKRLIEYYLN